MTAHLFIGTYLVSYNTEGYGYTGSGKFLSLEGLEKIDLAFSISRYTNCVVARVTDN